MTQDVILFNDTVRANMTYGNPGAGDEAIIRAAEAALVDDFVAGRPEGYDTRIGERGLRLYRAGNAKGFPSPGALLKNAPILILDEATSSGQAARLSGRIDPYCRRFLILIGLKAGGLGLNLTAAGLYGRGFRGSLPMGAAPGARKKTFMGFHLRLTAGDAAARSLPFRRY